MKAFVNELMRDASDAKRRQKVHRDHTFRFNSLSMLFFFQREMERGVSTRVEKAEE
jgi:hypothetical protein